MKTPAIIFIVIGLIGAAMLSYAMYTVAKKPIIFPVVEKEQTQQIVVAGSNLSLGTKLREENLRLVPWSERNRPSGYFPSLDAIKDRVLLQNVVENEPILENKLTPTTLKQAGLTAVIQEGRRAFSIRVTDIINVAGYVTPGTVVDVLVTGTPHHNAGQQGPQTKTILQNIPVLTAGQQIEYNPDGKPITNVNVVTLQVTPEEAERLSLASLEGKIQLALRNPLDKKVETTPGAQFTGLFTGTRSAAAVAAKPRVAKPKPAPEVVAPAPPPPVPKPLPAMEVINGGKKATYTF